jgi:hypothetical protein
VIPPFDDIWQAVLNLRGDIAYLRKLVGGGGGTLQNILKNRAQSLQTAAVFSIAAGGNFTAPVTITMIASGKVRISANASFSTEGFVNPIVSVSINGDPVANVVWSFQEQSGSESVASRSVVATTFELDTVALPGQTVQALFTSSLTDASADSFTLGLGDASSNLLIEELP